MDRQKIFWVVLSVSVFVVVVLVVGVLLLRQKPAALAAGPATVSPLSDPGTQVYEYSRQAPASEGTETMRFVIGGDEQPSQGETAPASQSPPPAAAPASKSPVAARSAVPARNAAPAKPAAPKAAGRTGPEYWIQTGSYRSQTKAEELATLLGGKGLAGRVFSSAAGKENYFRVRIGPYTNKGEAEKFLATVKQIQGLESSYISMVGGARRAN
jgi:cell division septation protein DedD